MKNRKKSSFLNLGTAIIISMILGILVGALMGKKASMFAPLGNIFMQLIKMVIMPLVFCSIVSGASSIGESKSAGKMGITTFVYYLATTAIAVCIGLLFGELFKPGASVEIEAFKSMFSNEFASKGHIPGFWETVQGFIPDNPIKALVEGNIIQVIFFSLFLGFGISSLPKEKKELLTNVFNYTNDALIYVITKVMYVAPIGVFALMADATGTFGYKILKSLLFLLIVDILALCVHNFGVYSLFIKLLSKTSLKKFWKSIYKVQLMAFSTSSSMAALPLNIESCENDLGVSKETASFVLPLGATINMDGNAIYYALVACFFAQVFHIHLGPAQYIAIIFTATIGSIGQAGVPGPSLLVVAVLLAANIPVVGLPLLFGVDRIFDMLRTSVNVVGDASCAVIVEKIKQTS
ncbi:dicarboxylate/amino acid:cation symporter [Clostridium sp. Marseille-Q2269]|uniref:dicarboxylate/amino acid:cation symporter n=1 Tax=Clostridium sp. Marseille-Q2269 TaxID=2942205 RepID=UPI0020743CB1|nr:dicarboxylate/amino acid:cation symporter [Clostridium sp. Marseille-Q2269]